MDLEEYFGWMERYQRVGFGADRDNFKMALMLEMMDTLIKVCAKSDKVDKNGLEEKLKLLSETELEKDQLRLILDERKELRRRRQALAERFARKRGQLE